MRCIFCKKLSDNSKSVEHILPESLGNKEHILPKGIVCDRCNNYFGCKIEGPILATLYFSHLRSRNRIPNKKGIAPSVLANMFGTHFEVTLRYEDDKSMSIGTRFEKDESLFINHILSNNGGRMLVPIPSPVDKKLLSRFLAKIALEILTQRIFHIEGWEMEVVDNSALDAIRNYARVGNTTALWEISERRILPENAIFKGESYYEILYEYTLLYTLKKEIYAVICIFGIEYAINLGGPEITGYQQWLNENNQRSPLYL